MPPKKDLKESNNKTDQTQNATSSPKVQNNSSPAKETSPDKNLNKNFISKENYFGVKASPTHGIGKTLSSGTHSPILNYYSNVSSEGKDYYYSPKEGNNQNSFNSNKISPMNFNYSPSTIFNMPKNNNQNKDLSNNEEDSKTLQEKMEPLVSNLNMNSDNNNFMMRVASFPSNGSNLQDKNEEEEEEEILTLSIDSGEENYLLGMDKDKNLHFNLNEQEKKENSGKNNNSNNLKNKGENEKDKKKSEDKEKKEDFNSIKQINTIYNNIQKSYNDTNNINNINNNNIMNNLNLNTNNANNINENANANINLNNNLNNNNNINAYNFFNINNNQNIIQPPEQQESLIQNIINKKEIKPYIPNQFRNQYPEDMPNNYYNNMNMNMNYILNKNYAPKINFNIPYNQNNNPNMINNMNNNYINNFNNLNNNNLYMNNNSLYPNPYSINNIPNNINNVNRFNNNFIPQMPSQLNKNNIFYKEPENNNNDNSYNNFYYNGDKYQISNSKEYKKNETGELRSINDSDLVTAITVNNKVIKRIDPNTYLNESIEYLSFNILPLAKDQAGCRFLQEKLEKDQNAPKAFYNAILPHILALVKDPFGNYLVQKICNYLNEEEIKKIFEIISPNILDIGSNSHGTRVIQHLVNFLKTEDLVNYFLNILKPHVIPLLKELNGTHIINKFITDHPECANEINKIIVENSSTLATHRHGCCILQRLLDGTDKKLKNDLIDNLIENCFVLIIDQFGNYVIQSILLLNNAKASGAIALKICDNLQYYSKHRYSSNVIEKCFDYCGRKEKKVLVQKICSPEMIADLILDEHGNYVVQKALFYADQKEKEFILQNIVMLIPKIRLAPFGEKLLNRLVLNYPILNNYIYENFNYPELMQNLSLENNNNMNNNNYHQKNKKKNMKKKNKKKVNNNNNENNTNDNIFFNNQNPFLNNSNNNFLKNNINVNNNITINNFNNINNNNQNNKNQNSENNPINYMNFNDNMMNSNFNPNMNYMQGNMNNININAEENKKKNKKKRKNKNKKYNNESYNQYENNDQEEIDNKQNEN